MAGFSDYLENKLLDHVRGVAYTVPAGLFVALYSAAPTDAGGGTEVTTTLRTAGRVAVPFGAAAGGAMANSAAVDFGAAVGSATITHFGIFDAAAGGNFLGWDIIRNPDTNAPYSPPLAISPGIITSLATGVLVWSLD